MYRDMIERDMLAMKASEYFEWRSARCICICIMYSTYFLCCILPVQWLHNFFLPFNIYRCYLFNCPLKQRFEQRI